MTASPSRDTYGWRTLALVFAGAAFMLAVIDMLLRALLPFPGHRKEVIDALRAYEVADPTILVLGSSHARTFDSIGSRLAAESADSIRLLSVPLEYGKHTGFYWVLKHKLAPLIDEVDASGQKRRPSLRQAIVVTTWWDSCHNDPKTLNIPARAWGFDDFRADLLQNGITNYNRAFLSAHWSGLLSFSALVRNRVGSWIPGAVRERFLTPEHNRAHEEQMTAEWQSMVETGQGCIANLAQMTAMDSILDFFKARNLPVTLVLYPLKPGTLTETARETTLPNFALTMDGVARQRGLRLIDAVTSSPLTDDDFSPDYDHLRPRGDSHFASWALAGPFAFLREAPHAVNTSQVSP